MRTEKQAQVLAELRGTINDSSIGGTSLRLIEL